MLEFITGGMLLSPGVIRKHAEQAGLEMHTPYCFGKDYARTLREWLIRFNAAEGAIRAQGYSDPFIRGWRYYLQTCAGAFEVGRTDVAQITFTHREAA